MPPFQPSENVDGKRTMWARGVKNPNHSRINIFKNYWEEFNTMRVPILGEDRFFEIALELEQMATDEEDLKRLLLERRKLWEKEAVEWLRTIARKTSFPEEEVLCLDARQTVHRVTQTGSLQHFFELLNGLVCGWEADEVEYIRGSLTRSHEDCGTGTQKFGGYNELVIQRLNSGNFAYEPALDDNFHKAPVFTSDKSSHFRQHLLNENTNQESKSPNTSKNGNAGPIKDLSRSNKRPRLDDEIDGQARKRQKRELVAYADTSTHSNSGNTSFANSSTNTLSTDVTQSTPARATRGTLQKNQSRTPTGTTTPPLAKIGLYASDKSGGRGRKHQSTSSEPPSPKYPDISSTSAEKKSPRKSNARDGRKKRHGIQPVSTQASSSASSESHQPRSSGKVTKRYKNERDSRRTPSLHSSTQSSRSTRRNTALSLWALDSSGNPCLLPNSRSRK